MIKTIEWTDEGVVMIDQRLLPTQELYPVFRTCEEVAKAIEDMVVRGAPAIGVAAAMGIAIGVKNSNATSLEDLEVEFAQLCARISRTRPTAVNLFWSVERMVWVFNRARRSMGWLIPIAPLVSLAGSPVYRCKLSIIRLL